MNTSDGRIKQLITLLYANLAVSMLIGILTLVLWNQVIDFEVAHRPGGAGGDAASVRHTLTLVTGIVPVVVFAVSLLYVRIAKRLRLGHRRAYVRVLVIAVAGMIGLAYPTISGQYPGWMRACHAVQEVILLLLLLTATRPEVRARFTGRVATELGSGDLQ